MRAKLWLTLLACCLSVAGDAQDYIAYQRVINRVDSDVISGNLSTAALRMDSIDRAYDFVYSYHCIKALQISIKLGDESRAGHWLARSMIQGVPLWVIRSNELTRKIFDLPVGQKIAAQADSLHAIYISHIDTALNRRIRRLMDADAIRTRRVNDGNPLLRHTIYGLQWVHNNTKEVIQLVDIIRQYGYPEEKVVGLSLNLEDSAALTPFMRDAGTDLVLRNREAFFMFLHYFSTKRKDMNDLLLPQVAAGNMPPYQYARINDYLSINTSARRYPRFYHFGRLPEGADPAAVNARRAAIGLPSCEAQLRTERLYLEYRKSGRLNREVILD